MSELQSNNPFRDRASPYMGTKTAADQSSGSKNPFLDIMSSSPASSSKVPSSSVDRNGSRGPDGRRSNGASHEEGSIRKERSERHGPDGDVRKTRDGSDVLVNNRERSSRPSHTAGARPLRPRSSSETSAAEIKKKDQKDDKHRRDRADKKNVKGSSKSRSRKHLDKIDLLDVTGFATSGAGFHHDGPFDACNPNRNKNAKKAPVLAFAKDSTAMSLAAGPPVQPVYFGDHVGNVESFADFGSAGHKIRPTVATRSTSFDPASNIDPIHGYESVGLGTTTFLEGAPASRSAMLARTTSESGPSSNEGRPRATSDHGASGAGLGRKKSVLQKIRGAYRERAAEAQQDYSASPPSSPFRVQDSTKGYFDENKEAQATTSSVSNESSFLGEAVSSDPSQPSPLYRPASTGAGNSTNGGATGLIKGVRSIRISNKKRQE